MKLKELSSFEKSMKEIGNILFKDSSIKEGTRTALLINLGRLTHAAKIPKHERDWISINLAVHDITKLVSNIKSLQSVWDESKPIFLDALKNSQ